MELRDHSMTDEVLRELLKARHLYKIGEHHEAWKHIDKAVLAQYIKLAEEYNAKTNRAGQAIKEDETQK
jgi:hypothetical protein